MAFDLSSGSDFDLKGSNSLEKSDSGDEENEEEVDLIPCYP